MFSISWYPLTVPAALKTLDDIVWPCSITLECKIKLFSLIESSYESDYSMNSKLDCVAGDERCGISSPSFREGWSRATNMKRKNHTLQKLRDCITQETWTRARWWAIAFSFCTCSRLFMRWSMWDGGASVAWDSSQVKLSLLLLPPFHSWLRHSEPPRRLLAAMYCRNEKR